MPRPGAAALLYAASLGLHVAAAVALARVKPPAEPPPVEIIRVRTVVVPKPKPPEPEPPPPAPEAPKPALSRPKAPAPPVSPMPPPSPTAAPIPDFGISLGGGGGPGGLAIAAAKDTAAPAAARSVTKALATPAPGGDTCADPEVKAKALSLPHPAYTEEARAAGLEGKVRVELAVDAAGHVTDAKVVAGLGSGLDEAALDAVRQATFAPATRCGAPVASTFTIAIRFAL